MIDSAKVDRLKERIRKLSKEDLDSFTNTLEIHVAHLLKRSKKLRDAHPEQWEETKHLSKEFNYIGYLVKQKKLQATK